MTTEVLEQGPARKTKFQGMDRVVLAGLHQSRPDFSQLLVHQAQIWA
jgi:hypothetical protein